MTDSGRLQLKALSSDNIKKSPGRKEFQRGVVRVDDQGRLWVTTTGAQGSGILSSMSKANCFILLEASQTSISAGEEVTIELFDNLLR
jgi:molybdopterin molybdotransferase